MHVDWSRRTLRNVVPTDDDRVKVQGMWFRVMSVLKSDDPLKLELCAHYKMVYGERYHAERYRTETKEYLLVLFPEWSDSQ